MPLILPNDIQSNTTADAVEVEQNYNVIEQYVNTNVINRDGSVAMTNPLLLVGDPTADKHAATKAYVDAILPVGIIVPFGGVAAPAGSWRLCNGGGMTVSSWPALFGIIGYRYGGGGSTFNLPNLQGRFPLGIHSTDARFNVTGEYGGTFEAQLAYHSHTIDHNHGSLSTGGQSASHTHEHPHSHPMPHTHTFSDTSGTQSANHTHAISGTTSSAGAHSHGPTGSATSFLAVGTGTGNWGPNAGTFGGTSVTDTEAAHTHTFSDTSGNNSVSHTHAISGTTSASSAGSTSGTPSDATTGGASVGHTHSVDLPAFSGSSGTAGTSGVDQIPQFLVVSYIIRVD